ncbi:MAG: hypothetical protein OQL19_16325 [Gammaproteobacteria bacterium]|nr:hypothetical protein [Gammaproteobacteria bacterium]
MLKIRIAGTESELRQVAHKAGSTRIKRFKRENCKTSFAIDVEISVSDFLENLDLNSGSEETDSHEQKCNPQEIQAELEDLLEEISDK